MTSTPPAPSDRYASFFRELQLQISTALEKIDGQATFLEDAWQRPGGGGGYTRVMTGGAVFEKAGVNWSEVYGEMDPAFAARLPGDGTKFRATGVSLVLHPLSPRIPTVHANFRSIEKAGVRWFGGGADLTPYYPVDSDVLHFHRTLKSACDRHDPTWYPRFKTWCDNYFYLPHRQETRGVGGLFFDYVGLPGDDVAKLAGHEAAHLLSGPVPLEDGFRFVQDVGSTFLPAYVPIVESRRHESWNDAQRDFQLIRRGRYAEFNLIYDRGTLFGLKTGGRTESILMSLPPHARWVYDHRPEAGSEEARLWEYLKARDWLEELGSD